MDNYIPIDFDDVITYVGASWLHYVDSLKNRTPVEQREYNRLGYTTNVNVYPDYLDYVDEWKYAARQVVNDLTMTCVYSYAYNNRKIQCNCSAVHTLSLWNTHTIIDPKLTFMDMPSDVNLTMNDMIMRSLNTLEHQGAELPEQ